MKAIVEANAGSSMRTSVEVVYSPAGYDEPRPDLAPRLTLPLGTKETKPRTAMCFDVFDTLLTRAVGFPKDLFLLLGSRLLHDGRIQCSGEIFARHRMYAEERASSIANRHPTLEEIYREVVGSLRLSESEVPALIAAELALEKELSRKVGTADKILRTARRTTGSVVFATDTNMPAAFIQKLLTHHGLWRPADLIVTSCESGVDKAHGTMFPHIARKLKLKPWQVQHHGNDSVADVRNGRRSGWKVRQLSEGNLNRYEKALAEQSFATGGLSSLLAGASRLARTHKEAQSKREEVLREVAAGVMAPTLTAWVLWTMRRAVEKGCRRLYFISRDGQILLEIAKELETVLLTGLDLRYLYGSRRAVQFAVDPYAALQDCMRLQVCTVSDIADMFGKPPEMLADMLPSNLREPASWSDNISASDRSEVLLAASRDTCQRRICEWSSSTKSTLFEYLRQEGWEDDIPFGLVDVGWRASMAGVLSAALRGTVFHLPATYFYFGLGKDAYQVAGSELIPLLHAWFFDDSAKSGYLPYLPSTSSLIEMFCAGSHGAVIGYERQNGKIVPTLRTKTSPMEEWGLPILWEATAEFVGSFARTIQGTPNAVDLDVDLRRGVSSVLQLFWLNPSRPEVKYWGTFPAEINLNQTCVQPLAGAVKTGRVINAALGRGKLRAQHSWPAGTALASSMLYRVVLLWLWRGRANLPRLRRRAVWLRSQLAAVVGRQ